jgi:hypothetical protein
MENFQIDEIIKLMKRYTPKKDIDGELDEQDAATATASGGGAKPAYPTVTKWESGATRGPANQIGNTKWKDIVKVTRGKANTLL